MKADPNKSVWDSLRRGTRLGIYLLLTFSTGLFGVVVGYIIYLEATNSPVPVLSNFPPFIASLLIIGLSSIFVSVYMSTQKGSTHSDVLGALWILALLEILPHLNPNYCSKAHEHPWIRSLKEESGNGWYLAGPSYKLAQL